MQEMIKYDTSVNGTWSPNNGGLFTPKVQGDFVDATGRKYRDYVLAPMSFTRLLRWAKVADQKKTDFRTPGKMLSTVPPIKNFYLILIPSCLLFSNCNCSLIIIQLILFLFYFFLFFFFINKP